LCYGVKNYKKLKFIYCGKETVEQSSSGLFPAMFEENIIFENRRKTTGQDTGYEVTVRTSDTTNSFESQITTVEYHLERQKANKRRPVNVLVERGK
jgi:hypothetical protein